MLDISRRRDRVNVPAAAGLWTRSTTLGDGRQSKGRADRIVDAQLRSWTETLLASRVVRKHRPHQPVHCCRRRWFETVDVAVGGFVCRSRNAVVGQRSSPGMDVAQSRQEPMLLLL